jgi:hypothetical protein
VRFSQAHVEETHHAIVVTACDKISPRVNPAPYAFTTIATTATAVGIARKGGDRC